MTRRLSLRRAERERLRAKGQFWTPDWVAEAMTAYVAAHTCTVFDPAAGEGAFYRALLRVCRGRSEPIRFIGSDLDGQLLMKVKEQDWYDPATCQLETRDFLQTPTQTTYPAIVANPPYIRHHRLTRELKDRLSYLSRRTLGQKLDGRAGLHVYFLIQALTLLQDGGRLAFIMPADTCEGVFAHTLWEWIARRFCLDCVITFAPEASPFPDVDTNTMIFLIRRAEPGDHVLWVRCVRRGSDQVRRFIESSFSDLALGDLEVYRRSLKEALSTGLSRPPQSEKEPVFRLRDFAHVMRGIATGANDFFFLTVEQAADLKLPADFLRPAIGRTRDVTGSAVTQETMAALAARGRPTLLFSPNGDDPASFPRSVRDYLERGVERGLPNRALLSTRHPWYRMERRAAPPFLFAYLGRRNARFIKNDARAVPLTGFLCVYPNSDDPVYVQRLWHVLQHQKTIANLRLVGKSYGAGAIKVEPRALENLPIPSSVVAAAGLAPIRIAYDKPPQLDFGQQMVAGAHSSA